MPPFQRVSIVFFIVVSSVAALAGCTDPATRSNASVGDSVFGDDTTENNNNNNNTNTNNTTDPNNATSSVTEEDSGASTMDTSLPENDTPSVVEDVAESPPDVVVMDVPLADDVPADTTQEDQCVSEDGGVPFSIHLLASNGVRQGIPWSGAPLPVHDAIYLERYAEGDEGESPGQLEIFKVNYEGWTEAQWTDDEQDDTLLGATDAGVVWYKRTSSSEHSLFVDIGLGHEHVIGGQGTLSGIDDFGRQRRLIDDQARIAFRGAPSGTLQTYDPTNRTGVQEIVSGWRALDWPYIDAGRVVWSGIVDDGESYQAYLYEEGQITQVSAGEGPARQPFLAGEVVYWAGEGQILSRTLGADEPPVVVIDEYCSAMGASGDLAFFVCRRTLTETSWESQLLISRGGGPAELILTAPFGIVTARLSGDYLAWVEAREIPEFIEQADLHVMDLTTGARSHLAAVGLGCTSCQVPWPPFQMEFSSEVLAWNYALTSDERRFDVGVAFLGERACP